MNKIDMYNVLYGGGTNCFGEMLFKLIMKADAFNRGKLKKGFPEAVALYEEWMVKGNKEFFKGKMI